MASRNADNVKLTAEEYRAFLDRHSLRQSDGAWMCDRCLRQGANWVNDGVTGAPALILMAFDDGLIPLEWFLGKIKLPIP